MPLPSSGSGSDEDEDGDLSGDEDELMVDGRGQALDGYDEEADPEEDVDKEGWGTSRKAFYGGDLLETEQDAIEEEEEAKRLQKKQLEKMTAADFFDENEWLDSGRADQENDSDEDGPIQEVLPQIEITDDMPEKEKNRILTARYPEFLALSKDFLELQADYEQTLLDSRAAIKLRETQQAKNTSEEPPMPGAVIRWTALSTYLSALTLYFAIFTSGPLDSDGKHTAKAPTELRAHSIMDTLVKARTNWFKVKDLKLPDPTEEVALEAQREEIVPVSIEDNEDVGPKPRQNGQPKKKRKSKAQIEAEKALAEAEARRIERQRKTAATFDKLARQAAREAKAGISETASPHTKAPVQDDNSDFGEDPVTFDDRSSNRKKKSLQFYTSQIAQKSNRRRAAHDTGGDTDIPYRERFKDRQARLNTAAEARGRKRDQDQDTSLGDSSGGEDDARAASELRAAGNKDADDYYATIASQTAAKKADRAARKEAQREATLRGAAVRPVEEVGPDGKRAISYAIEKNKGLTPKRRKEVRNPRVKKRKKYEDKMKKLGTIKQVYKGGPGRGGYQGEQTGISAGVVRSVKL